MIEKVKYSFECEDYGHVEWHIRRVRLEEQLSSPYELTVDLICDDIELDTDGLLGASCELLIERGSAMRMAKGVVRCVDFIDITEDRLYVRVTAVPALRLLEDRVDSRLFQDMSVVDILEEVLSSALADYDRKLEVKVNGSYSPRDYCVQYRESDFGFASRLMEEEGITYYFDHSAAGTPEVLVLIDSNDSFPDVETYDGGAVPVVRKRGETASVEHVRALELRRTLRTTTVARRDHDFLTPTAPPEHIEKGKDDRGRVREDYDPGERRFANDDGGEIIKRKLESHRADHRVGRGAGNAISFTPGHAFELEEHPRDALNDEYVITRIVHQGDCPEESLFGRGPEYAEGVRYENSFECITKSTPFRPKRRQRRPKIYGPQMARVTGPAGEEIHTDEHGRICVLFLWDRQNPDDETSSCWVRVAQRWAGLGWGALFIPRIGMEVIVEFLDGNPDRPVVTGCVYNGDNPPPYALPDEKTKSTLKSNSSPGGGGFNEFRFEDAAGSEEIFLHGQKDWTIQINNDKNQTVGHDETLSVGNDRSKSVGNNQSESVGVDKSIEVGSNHSETIGANMDQTVGVDMSVTIGSNQTVSIGSNKTQTIGSNKTENIGSNYEQSVGTSRSESVGLMYDLSVGAAMNKSVGAAFIEEVGAVKAVTVGANSSEDVGINKSLSAGSSISHSAGKDYSVSAGKDVAVSSGKKMSLSASDDFALSGSKKGVISISDELTIKVGSASITMKKNGDIVVKGKKISVKGSGDVVLKGSKVKAN